MTAANVFPRKHALGVVHHGDCVEFMRAIPRASADLVFVDPPFNIGYEYDIYNDRKSAEEYLDWCLGWGREAARLVSDQGSLWLAIGDEYAAELKVLFHRDLGLSFRSWVVWHYTFGVNCKNKFTRSHAHLLHFTKGSRGFYFDPSSVRVPSARSLVYNDKRANPSGRLPDDTWILRPQDAPDAFDPGSDSWHVPRVCGSFKERQGFHGCQMPERVLARIVASCCPPDGVVLDPMAGSGTTLAVAKKLGRRFLGIELSPDYANAANARIGSVNVGDPIPGSDYHVPGRK
jgi:site-specific DNA-methyltransferase (adenine-specific)